jgi:hypothetical protein
MGRVASWSIVGLLLASCAADTIDPLAPGLASVPSTAIFVVAPTLATSADFAPAADPKLEGFEGWLLSFDAAHHTVDGRICTITVLRDGLEVARPPVTTSAGSCAAIWDGRTGSGAFLAPGALDVSAVVTSAEGDELARADAIAEVVRLGVPEIQLGAVPGTGARAALLYRATDGVRGGFYEISASDVSFRMGPDAREGAAAVDLEDEEGNPRAIPPPWDDLTSPPLDARSADDVEHDTFNLPTAFASGTRLAIEARMSASVAGMDGGGAPVLTEIRVVAPDGTTFDESGSDAFVHGETLLLASDASPVPNVGRYDLALTFRFEARAPDGEWQPMPGAISTVHRVYGLVALPTFDYPDVPHRAWVDVVDLVASWVDGATNDADEVAGHIVDGVYYELGLSYDRERGASFYTNYPSGWTGAIFDASRFQERTNGETINCSDAGSIVSTYANMVGIDLRYHILAHRFASGFDLNYIQAIGWMGFTEAPFTSGRGSFRYHAVVGPPDGRFFDATLALDGDGTPTAPPHTSLLAHGMDPMDYKTALSSEASSVATSVDEKVRLR